MSAGYFYRKSVFDRDKDWSLMDGQLTALGCSAFMFKVNAVGIIL